MLKTNDGYEVITLREALDRVGLLDNRNGAPRVDMSGVGLGALDLLVTPGHVVASSGATDQGRLFAHASGPILFSWQRVAKGHNDRVPDYYFRLGHCSMAVVLVIDARISYGVAHVAGVTLRMVVTG